MRAWPEGVEESELRLALAGDWHIDAVAVDYAAVGGGSYHWVVRDREDTRRFVTVDDLDHKGWLGRSRAATFQNLRVAMDTALVLRNQGGLGFVVAPIPTVLGESLRPLGSRYAVAVYPFLEGAAGRFGEAPPDHERAELVDILAALHGSISAAVGASVCQFELPGRGALEAALSELDQPWRGGPFGEQARSLLARRSQELRRQLATFDQLAERVAAAGRERVITHGEPHPGNVMRMGAQRLLVDWDTVGLAPPERDLWMVVSESGKEIRRYTEATGRSVDPVALALYRLRWALDDTSIYVQQLRFEHRRTADTEHAWLGLKETLEHVAGHRRAPDPAGGRLGSAS